MCVGKIQVVGSILTSRGVLFNVKGTVYKACVPRVLILYGTVTPDQWSWMICSACKERTYDDGKMDVYGEVVIESQEQNINCGVKWTTVCGVCLVWRAWLTNILFFTIGGASFHFINGHQRWQNPLAVENVPNSHGACPVTSWLLWV